MSASTDPAARDLTEALSQSAAPPEPYPGINDGQHDVYAESELQTRHERTERMIQKALEQS
jgi:hypothetical protein